MRTSALFDAKNFGIFETYSAPHGQEGRGQYFTILCRRSLWTVPLLNLYVEIKLFQKPKKQQLTKKLITVSASSISPRTRFYLITTWRPQRHSKHVIFITSLCVKMGATSRRCTAGHHENHQQKLKTLV